MDFQIKVTGDPPVWKTTPAGTSGLMNVVLSQGALMNLPLTRAYEAVGGIVQAEAKGRVPVNNGILRKSIVWDLGYTTSTGTLPNYPTYVRVGTSVTYARPVHDGRAPGSKMPPVDAIAQWVVEKKILNKNGKGKRKDVASKAVRAAAFAIAKSIAKKGIPAKPFLKDALIMSGPKIKAEFAHAAKAMQVLWDG
jgi:hypothetical protein